MIPLKCPRKLAFGIINCVTRRIKNGPAFAFRIIGWVDRVIVGKEYGVSWGKGVKVGERREDIVRRENITPE